MFSKCHENGYTLFIGDFNSMLGNLYNISSKTWKYEDHFYVITNIHGRTFMVDICKRNKIYPVNNLKYKGKPFMATLRILKMKRNLKLIIY